MLRSLTSSESVKNKFKKFFVGFLRIEGDEYIISPDPHPAPAPYPKSQTHRAAVYRASAHGP